jgi:glyoxylase-like metal-dependent hydrolase (beta-lactamase superfamily II)
MTKLHCIWHVLNIGNLSRNCFWGEDDSTSRRGAVCTSSLVYDGSTLILVDPPHEARSMASLLDQRCGVNPAQVDMVFMTHAHGDHRMGLESFPNAELLMPEMELRELRIRTDIPLVQRIQGAGTRLTPSTEVIPLPGHTAGLCGLLLDAAEGRVLIAGDAVYTRDHYGTRNAGFNCADRAQALQTYERIAGLADVVVPGHDNLFLVEAVQVQPCAAIRIDSRVQGISEDP